MTKPTENQSFCLSLYVSVYVPCTHAMCVYVCKHIHSLKPNYCTPSRRVFSSFSSIHFVVPLHSMPEDPSVNQTAGYISVNPITKYFFWLFEAKEHLVGSMVIPLAGYSDYSLFLFSSFFLGSYNGFKRSNIQKLRRGTPLPHHW